MPGWGGARGVAGAAGVVVGAQHPEEAAHVGEGGAAGLGDDLEGGPRGLGAGPCGVPAAVGLRDHHGQRVGDDVVHLARDAGALGGGGELGLLVALDLEAARAFPQGVQQVLARAAHEAERPRRHDQGAGQGGDPQAGAELAVVERDDRAEQAGAAEGHTERRAVRPHRPVDGDGVQGDEDGDVGGQDERDARGDVRERRQRYGRRRPDRLGPAPGERRHHEHRPQREEVDPAGDETGRPRDDDGQQDGEPAENQRGHQVHPEAVAFGAARRRLVPAHGRRLGQAPGRVVSPW